MTSLPERTKTTLQTTLADAREGAAALPEVRQDRNRVRDWLVGARRAQIFAAVALVVGLFVWPSIRDFVVDTTLPSRTTRSLFRSRTHSHPAADSASFALDAFYWSLAFVGTGALLLARLARMRREDAEAASGQGTAERPRPMNAPGGAGHAQGVPQAGAPAGTAATMMAAGQALGTAATMAPGGAPGSAPGASGPGFVGASLAPATQPSRYATEGELGRGGMGVVYRARDTVLDRPVALKELPVGALSSAEASERFRTEARALAKLSHPGIVQVYDLVEGPEGMWIAMELVDGAPLDDILEERGALPLREAVDLARGMAEAMAYAHEQGVIHRDFKPANVLVSSSGDPKVTDFGLAKMTHSGPSMTREGTVMGTPAYLAPEQAAGDTVDARADIYAMGVTLYEMVTGRVPFDGDTAQMLMKHITQQPPTPREFREELPEPLEGLILAMLAKDREDRPQTMRDVASALEAI